MLKLTVAILAIALAGTASAEKWRDLRVNGTSEEAFEQSLETFKKKLSSAREYVFDNALNDIWMQGAKAAEAEQREYTADEYYRQLDGLRYEQIVNYTDPTGDTARSRLHTARLLYRLNGPVFSMEEVVEPRGPAERMGSTYRPRSN